MTDGERQTETDGESATASVTQTIFLPTTGQSGQGLRPIIGWYWTSHLERKREGERERGRQGESERGRGGKREGEIA